MKGEEETCERRDSMAPSRIDLAVGIENMGALYYRNGLRLRCYVRFGEDLSLGLLPLLTLWSIM